MEIYWEEVVENILGGGNNTKIEAANSVSKKKEGPVSKTGKNNSIADEGAKIAAAGDKNRKAHDKKKVKFQNEVASVSRGLMNASLTSDEGIDTTFLSQASTSSSQNSMSPGFTSIPTAIRRPQHPLKTSWTFWYSAGNRKLSWEQNQVKISTVSTAEQFWLLISQLKPPSDIPAGYTFSVFREGILPDWEDTPNIEGGRWMVPCKKVDGLDKFDSKWLDLLFMLVGEQLNDESSLINGAEACARTKGNRMEVWVNNATTKEVVVIGRTIKSKLKCDQERITFSLHKEDRSGIKGPRLAL